MSPQVRQGLLEWLAFQELDVIGNRRNVEEAIRLGIETLLLCLWNDGLVQVEA